MLRSARFAIPTLRFSPARSLLLAAAFLAVSFVGSPVEAAPLKYPAQINAENPHADRAKKARMAFADSYKKIWTDYYRRSWDYALYVRNYNAYVRAWYTYQWALYYYYRWEYNNQRAFSGSVVTTRLIAQPRPLEVGADTTSSSNSIIAPTQPVSGAKIELVSDIRYIVDPGPGGIPRYETRSDSRGEFRFRNLKTGRYTVTVTRSGYETHTGTVTIEDGSVTRTFVLARRQTKLVEGNVYYVEPGWLPQPLRERVSQGDMSSETAEELADLVESPTPEARLLPSRLIPVDDQDVVFTRTDPVIQIYPPPPAEVHRARTNSAGNFRIDGLKGENYEVEVKRWGFHTYTRSLQLADGANRVTIILVRVYEGFDDLYFTDGP